MAESHDVGWLSEGAKILELCEKGDALLDEEIGKVYKGKKIQKGVATPCTISPSSHVTPFTPLASEDDAGTELKAGEVVKIQLGAQIDGFGAIVGGNVVVPPKGEKKAKIEGREADLLLATHYANELLLRLMVPPGLLSAGTDEEKKKASAEKPPSQSKMIQLVEKVAAAYEVKVVQHTTSWLFERNDIEGKKKIILSPAADSSKGEGSPEVGEVWGVEVGMSLGSGKVKDLDKRSTLMRRTAITYGLKRPSSRQVLSEIVKKFGTFPFSLRQLDDEKAGKVGVIECVRNGVLREYKPAADSEGAPVSRMFSTVAITKNGLTRLAAPPALDLDTVKSDKKITDEEVLKILERPLSKSTGTKSKNKKKKKKTAKKAVAADEGEESEEESDDE
ncbi:hypothetical protein LTS08_003197 [Lithohypha guttulata]|uniref:Peptidase M24 domain-containing protein n=1 Tax=Lithohypha guttulata TaxID=1690604 RepID=A0AAN7SZH9_9EURO|nr:hypothetical protein LTR51_000145 [Lithohypha guttulata]KAK5085339.1 hypothetical protein LTR05_004623 [Lithohypha guttulata]KAK5103778.1 hypothetical protein LTS08_003197 [Lithohypha guttulata]